MCTKVVSSTTSLTEIASATKADHKLPIGKDIDGEFIIKTILPREIEKLDALLSPTGALGWNKRDSIVVVVAPRTVLKTHERLLVTGRRSDKDVIETRMVKGTEPTRYEGGAVSANKKLAELEAILLPYVVEASDTFNLLKTWVRYRVPKVEDGNNFGVEVQEMGMSTINGAECTASCVLSGLTSTNYETNRIETIQASTDNPDLEDYTSIMTKRDHSRFDKIREYARELRDMHIEVQTTLLKNLNKIKMPRARNASINAMYGDFNGDADEE